MSHYLYNIWVKSDTKGAYKGGYENRLYSGSRAYACVRIKRVSWQNIYLIKKMVGSVTIGV